MQNFNTSKYINVIGVKPHMIVKGHGSRSERGGVRSANGCEATQAPTAQGFAIYYHDNQYVIFNISCGNRLKIKTCKSLRVAKKYIQKNGINIPGKRNIEFRFPTTWEKVKIGQLKYTLDEYDETNKFLDRLLLQLI